MSVRRLPRQLGIVIVCDEHDCTERFQSAAIRIKPNRALLQTIGWGRGGGKYGNHSKRRDLCAAHASLEAERVAAKLKKLVAKKAARNEKLREVLAAHIPPSRSPRSLQALGPVGPTMNKLWASCSHAEKDEIRAALRERIHKKNADHAKSILRGLPKQWRDAVITHIRDLP